MAFPGDSGTEIARSLGGSPTDDELPTGGMAAAMEFGKDQVIILTNKKDWLTSDDADGSIAMARYYFASSYLRGIWKDKENKEKEHFERAVAILKGVLKNPGITSPSAPDTEHVSTNYTYLSAAMNPSAPFYKSPRTDI